FPSIGRHRQGRIGRSLLPDAHLVVRAKTHTGWRLVPPWRARSQNRHKPPSASTLVGLGLHPQDEALDRPDPDAGALADGAVHRPGAPERPLHHTPPSGLRSLRASPTSPTRPTWAVWMRSRDRSATVMANPKNRTLP